MLVTFVFQFTVVIGESMQPALDNGEVLFINKSIFSFKKPARGDIVVCKYPEEGSPQNPSKENYIKRIIGLPGDSIEIKDNVVYINDNPNIDKWMNGHRLPNLKKQTVKPGHYFVMGDNRSNSLDSEDYKIGQLPQSFIKGKAQLTLWPLREFGNIE